MERILCRGSFSRKLLKLYRFSLFLFKDHTILRERPTFKEYEVKVRAINERGMSSQAPEIISGFSGQDGEFF